MVDNAPTLSKMTRGPLTPPMVLYRILGWIVVMRESWTSLAIVRGFHRQSLGRSFVEGAVKTGKARPQDVTGQKLPYELPG